MEMWAVGKVSYARFKNQIDIVTWILGVGGNAGRRRGVGRKGKEGTARGVKGRGERGKRGGRRGGRSEGESERHC